MAKNFNHPKVVAAYDQHIRKLIPGYELIHLQIQAILKSRLAVDAKLLIVGCGTGYELSYLLDQFPSMTLVAIDPALEMLQQAQRNLSERADLSRVEFIYTDTQGLDAFTNHFDAVLSILVSHFIAEERKTNFFNDIAKVLKPNGLCITFDLLQIDNEADKIALQYLTESIGLPAIQSQAMLDRLEDDFHLITVDALKAIYHQAGFKKVETYTQILNFYGFIAIK